MSTSIFGSYLAMLRKQAGLTQGDLSRKLHDTLAVLGKQNEEVQQALLEILNKRFKEQILDGRFIGRIESSSRPRKLACRERILILSIIKVLSSKIDIEEANTLLRVGNYSSLTPDEISLLFHPDNRIRTRWSGELSDLCFHIRDLKWLYNHGCYEEYIRDSQQTLDNLIERFGLSKDKHIAEILRYRRFIFTDTRDKARLGAHLKEVEKYASASESKYLRVEYLLAQSVQAEWHLNDFSRSIAYREQALEDLKSIQNSNNDDEIADFIIETWNSLAGTFSRHGQFDKALWAYTKGIRIVGYFRSSQSTLPQPWFVVLPANVNIAHMRMGERDSCADILNTFPYLANENLSLRTKTAADITQAVALYKLGWKNEAKQLGEKVNSICQNHDSLRRPLCLEDHAWKEICEKERWVFRGRWFDIIYPTGSSYHDIVTSYVS